MQPVSARQCLRVGNPAKQVVGGYVECIGQPSQVVERGLAGTGLEMGDGGRLKSGATGESSLAQSALLPCGAEPSRE